MALEDPPEKAPGQKDLERLKRDYCDATEVAAEARRLAFRDLEYFHNFNDNQWTSQEKAELNQRNQPIVVSNWIKRRVLFAAGMEQRTRTDPKAYPRTPKDEQAASVVTDVLDFVETETRFDSIASRGFFDLSIMGIEAAEVIQQGNETIINRIAFEKFFVDPRSRDLDFSDARYMGYVDWFDKEEVEELFPDIENIDGMIASSYADGDLEEGYEDKPQYWGDRTRERVRVVVMYYKTAKNEWRFAYYTGGGILTEGQSPYQDDKGRSACPIVAQSMYVTQENERYGIVRDMISLNREVNMRRSLSLSLLKNRRIWARDKGVFPQPEAAKKEVARADGLLIANGVYQQDWGFIDSNAEITGNLELLQEAKGELQIQQANAALQGREVSGQSGKAILAQQSAGMTEDNQLFDVHNEWKLRIYRAIWARVKQFWKEEDYIRITDDENSFRFAHINVPVMGETVDPMTGQPMMGVVGIENELARMNVDIDIQTSPDMATLQHETFEMLVQLVQAGAPIPPDVLLQAAPQFKDKAKIIEAIKAQQEQAAPLQQAQVQLQMEKETAEVTKTKAETMNINAKTAKELMPEPKPEPKAQAPRGMNG